MGRWRGGSSEQFRDEATVFVDADGSADATGSRVPGTPTDATAAPNADACMNRRRFILDSLRSCRYDRGRDSRAPMLRQRANRTGWSLVRSPLVEAVGLSR